MNSYRANLYAYSANNNGKALFVPPCYANKTAREHGKALGVLFFV